MTGNNNFYETKWKTKIRNIMKSTYAAFLRYEILKAQERINVGE